MSPFQSLTSRGHLLPGVFSSADSRPRFFWAAFPKAAGQDSAPQGE